MHILEILLTSPYMSILYYSVLCHIRGLYERMSVSINSLEIITLYMVLKAVQKIAILLIGKKDIKVTK